MSERVVIDRMRLDCRGVRGVDDATAFTHEVLAALERDLDASLPASEETRWVPRLDVVLRVRRAGDAASVAIGRALAEAIAREAKTATSVPAGARATLLNAGVTPRVLHAAGVEADEAIAEHGWTIARLGRLARRGCVAALAAWLTRDRARAILRELCADFAARAARGDAAAPAVDVARVAARALLAARVAPIADDEPEILLVIALAWAARLGARDVRTSAGWARAIAHALGDETREGDASSANGAHARDEDDARREREASSAPDAGDPARARGDERAAEETREDALAPIVTRAAGLAYLVRPLFDLGWHRALSAVRHAPSLVLHLVLRRVLAILELPEDDPATWVLAGLLDAPDDDDRTEDFASWSDEEHAALARAAGADGADPADAWARALLDDLGARLDDVPARAVVAVPGTIRADAEAITVVMPFTDVYEPLLRAGLVADFPDVPWLEGRALRFAFEEAS